MVRFLFIILIALQSCSVSGQDSTEKKIKYTLVEQKAADDRIVKTANDSIYHFKVMPGDLVRNGNRSEVAVQFKSENEKTYRYSWDFNINGKFKQTVNNKNKYHFIIAQWWNGPTENQSMEDIKGMQSPPYHLSVIQKTDGLYLQIYYGLQGKNKKREAEFKIDPDKWHHVTTTVHWSTGEDGHATIKLADREFHFKGANKYNTVSNVFKVGLYRNKDNKDITELSIKNIEVVEIGQ